MRIHRASTAYPPRIWTRTALRVKELPGNDLLEHVDVRGEMVLVGLDAQRCRVPQRMPLDQPTLVPEGRVYARGVESMGMRNVVYTPLRQCADHVYLANYV